MSTGHHKEPAMPSKIAIVGAGHVGSTLAYSLAVSGLVREVVLIDADPGRAEGEAAGLNAGPVTPST
jgi:L-lactate dehydrogenase